MDFLGISKLLLHNILVMSFISELIFLLEGVGWFCRVGWCDGAG